MQQVRYRCYGFGAGRVTCYCRRFGPKPTHRRLYGTWRTRGLWTLRWLRPIAFRLCVDAPLAGRSACPKRSMKKCWSSTWMRLRKRRNDESVNGNNGRKLSEALSLPVTLSTQVTQCSPSAFAKSPQLGSQKTRPGSSEAASKLGLSSSRTQKRAGGGSTTGGGCGGMRRRGRRLSDAQRQAMGQASEWLAFQFLCRRHSDFVDETSWISENRAHFFGGSEGDDTAGYDFLVKTPQADWLYEVKSSLEDSGEFELTANEHRIASIESKDGRRRYRILYVPYVFSPEEWYVLELPNPMGETTRKKFSRVGRGSVRFRFERQ